VGLEGRKRSKLSRTSSKASCGLGNKLVMARWLVLLLVMALYSFLRQDTSSLNAQGGQRRNNYFNILRDIPTGSDTAPQRGGILGFVGFPIKLALNPFQGTCDVIHAFLMVLVLELLLGFQDRHAAFEVKPLCH
jgi:hypothetical protein